jgi:hypothetical protein
MKKKGAHFFKIFISLSRNQTTSCLEVSHLNYVKKFSLRFVENVLHFHYKDQRFNAADGGGRCLFCKAYEIHKLYTVRKKQKIKVKTGETNSSHENFYDSKVFGRPACFSFILQHRGM